MSPELAPEHRAILGAFVRHRVEYVLIGGVALQIHGWRGATNDVDLSVATDEANVVRINGALAELGADPGMPGALGTVFKTRYGRLELIRRADGIGGYADWLRHAETIELGDFSVRVGRPEDLIASKEAAGRQKDLDTLPAIRRDLADADRLPKHS